MAEVYLRANPSRPRELIREALEANLEPDEELRWFSIVKQFRLPAPLRWHPWLQLFAVKHWYVGITPERVLFGRVKFAGEPDPSGVITVPVADVTVGRRGQSGGDCSSRTLRAGCRGNSGLLTVLILTNWRKH